MIRRAREWAPFDRDVSNNDGYLYTTGASLSSQIASRRHSDAILAATDYRGKRVIDVGCGDGTYTIELFDRAGPASIYAFDPASNAIDVARKKAAGMDITFEVNIAYDIPCADNSFDIAHVRNVLHHMDRPVDALRESLRVASTVVVLEPNGYNVGLKLIEKLSKYHREHGEKSYLPHRLERWVRNWGAGSRPATGSASSRISAPTGSPARRRPWSRSWSPCRWSTDSGAAHSS